MTVGSMGKDCPLRANALIAGWGDVVIPMNKSLHYVAFVDFYKSLMNKITTAYELNMLFEK